MTPIVVNKTELAKRLGLTKGRITQFCKTGMPVCPDGKVDLDAALVRVAATRQCQANYSDRGVNKLAKGLAGARRDILAVAVVDTQPEAVPSEREMANIAQEMASGSIEKMAPPASTYADARAIRESALGQLAQLKLATEKGQLVEVAVVKRDWVSTLTGLRGRLLAVPARVAATLPHLSQADVATIGAEVYQALEELAHADMA